MWQNVADSCLGSISLTAYQSDTVKGFFNIGAPYGATAGDYMADTNQEDEKVPFIQQLLDSPFILLFIGVMVPMVVYTLWGVIDILMIPVAK